MAALTQITEDSLGDPAHCTMSLSEIKEELGLLYEMSERSGELDQDYVNYLLHAQELNSEYQLEQLEEHERWQNCVSGFVDECLSRMRSFVPLNIFSATIPSLLSEGLTPEIAKRILTKQCLWLVRMSSAEISRLHSVEIQNRFTTTGQQLDLIEMAALYASLPERFATDHTGKKVEWRNSIEREFKKMMIEHENGTLPHIKFRSPAYNDMPEDGPIDDRESTRELEVPCSKISFVPRKSFQETCSRHSIFNRRNSTDNPELESTLTCTSATPDIEIGSTIS